MGGSIYRQPGVVKRDREKGAHARAVVAPGSACAEAKGERLALLIAAATRVFASAALELLVSGHILAWLSGLYLFLAPRAAHPHVLQTTSSRV